MIVKLPVAIEQVGWVTDPNAGTDGVACCVLINALPDAAEIHPTELVTVKV